MTGRNPIHSNWHSNKFYALGKYIHDKGYKKALDIGCGSGLFEFFFHEDIEKITAIDHHREALEFVRYLCNKENITNVKTVQVNLEDISDPTLDNETYDLVVLLDVIEHLHVPTADHLLRYIGKILAPNGRFIVTTPNYGGLWRITERILDTFKLVPALNEVQHINRFTRKSLIGCFEKNGYENCNIEVLGTVAYILPFKSLSRTVSRIETKLNFPYGNLILAEFKKNNSA